MVTINPIITQLTQILRTTTINTAIKIMPYYAVAKGKRRGIFETWAECQESIKGVAHAKFKKFDSYAAAEEFVNMYNGKEIKSVTMQELASPEVKVESDEDLETYHDAFLTDDMNDNDILVAEHISKIDSIFESFKSKTKDLLTQFNEVAESYKNSIMEEMLNFKGKVLNDKVGTSNIKSATTPKRKRTTDNENTDQKKRKEKHALPVDKDGFVHVYTDGACENNGRPNCKAGLGVWFGENHPLNVGEPVKGRATNNVGEIQACTRAVEIAHSAGVKKLCINTDSQFVINSMTTWLPNWKKRDWKLKDGGPVKNKHDFIDLDNACQLVDVKWNYVKGHAGIAGNEGADALARKGAQMFGK
ncbi:ribonuclease H1 [Chrysoperla carnea]|uniref:ribonuclease H1 n=1 Tax=Chrysoperla carnea TaxID=189513 RepID=UPI001D06B4E1|nr:ribonuclease H1 [Chrysoperla carnea]